ncbi:ATP-binding protein [Actinoplanes rectilineatus]|uniref:ATP-binding protein n=1 Tax=Actinoplanes rectilineatus TaxID=113571 RepID=UPI0005F2ACB0|nr:ATP-binding protein [Actinoplanes rectilineatus]
MSVQRRLNVGFAALFLLWVTFLVVQFAVGGRVRSGHESRMERIEVARLANDEILQRMTDAETSVRGFQLTGENLFLEPYPPAREAVFAALNTAAGHTRDATVRQKLVEENLAARAWFTEYAGPIVAAGVTNTDEALISGGKQLFDTLRLVNRESAAAIEAEYQAEAKSGREATELVDLIAAVLVGVILVVGCLVVRTARRQLLVPLANLGDTIRSLAAGDRSARATPAGGREMRSVTDALNDLAAQTETLLAAEQARAARAGLRQAVGVELQEKSSERSSRDPAVTGRRIAQLVGSAVGADAVYCRFAHPSGAMVAVHWPGRAGGLSAPVEDDLLAGPPGRAGVRADGGFGVAMAGPSEPGFLHVYRVGPVDWTESEQRLLTAVAQEIERVLRQVAFQQDQARLISELRLLDQRKDVFIQTVTHELRTPLTSILGYTEMISEEDFAGLSPLQRRALSAIMRNAHRLHDTIGDLVLLDRPDSGAVGEPEPLDLVAIATAVHHELGNAARSKDLTVTFSAAEADQAWVLGDRVQLQRALRKLLDNAIKFTPGGGSVSLLLTADDRTVTITVTDTGIGIPAEDVPGLFTPFHRAGNAMDQAVQGPGLGLAIVRDIIRDHSGTIAVQSVVGRGSTFTLTFPVAPGPLTSEEREAAASVPA